MAGDAHGGGGKAPATPAWVGPLVAAVLCLVLLAAVLNWLDHGTFGGRRTAIYDDPPRDEEVVRRPAARERTAPPVRIVTDDRDRAAAARRRLPSPEEVARSVPHRTERIPVDCVDTHWRVENSNRCQSITWVPGDD